MEEQDDDGKDVIARAPDAVDEIIRSHIPDTDLDVAQRGRGEYGMITHLLPKQPRDIMTINYTLIILLMDEEAGRKRKTAALAYIVILLCHGLAHILEFRTIQNGRLRADDGGEAFEKPSPEITKTEAGASWETHVFGGMISPVSFESELAFINGLAIQSSRWWYLHGNES